jgi:hypothetical protein
MRTARPESKFAALQYGATPGGLPSASRFDPLTTVHVNRPFIFLFDLWSRLAGTGGTRGVVTFQRKQRGAGRIRFECPESNFQKSGVGFAGRAAC